ncbi:MAG: hypothetical protein ACRDRZ_12900 [Pseudonocardiaceae bacterium]
MGTILCSYGDDGHDHEGYAAQVLDDGSLTSTYSDDTAPRMTGQVVAACGCGWAGTTRYPATTGPFDEAAEELALAEWEHTHARPALEAAHARKWDRLHQFFVAGATELAPDSIRRASPATRRGALNRTLTRLDEAAQLARKLLEPLAQPGDGGAAGGTS